MGLEPSELVLVILAVDNLARATAFYSAAFDWTQTVDVPVYAEFELPGGMRVGLYDRTSFGRNTGQVPVATPPGQLGGTELYLHPKNLDDAIQRVIKAGARQLSSLAPRDWGDEAAYFADPDGNVIVLARPMPRY